ncbi:hydrophobe/amphiphile efflux-3 (HAE3) family transporter [Ectobacillus sp. JY-23]|uniref:efflux RND transporter permease subunit n=1 Tax=Ectobacillus sp. JY-23 TaxID=2933872 RepID=UPI001FF140B8|nr:hydrophobe/amphiphile efflux-3 (HAE3) family transporter [Ectobacillus sp. JY-23]UOY92314.1 hydrophobe/amphiphile efflux-3 (HAE3) family transporter [Ectobacillus sp. JY-23]
MRKVFKAIANAVNTKPKQIIIWLLLATILVGFGTSKMKVDLGQETMISHDNPIYKATKKYQDTFGSDTLFILLTEAEGSLLSEPTIYNVNTLQEDLKDISEIQSAFSYVNLLKTSANEAVTLQKNIAVELQDAVSKAVKEAASNGAPPLQQQQIAEQVQIQFMKELQNRYGAAFTQMQHIGEPGLNNPKFIQSVLFDESGHIREEATKLMPENGKHAMIILKVKGGIPYSELPALVQKVEDKVKAASLDGIEAKISGTPKIYGAIYNSMIRDMSLMLGLSIVLMAVILFFIFPVKWRLLSLPVVLISLVWTIGIMGYLGVPMSMVTMAILPILIGLGTDFAIQFHNRYDEEIKAGHSVSKAITQSMHKMGPSVGIAVFSMTLGFITLLISKVPMIQHFGIMLSVGVIVSYSLSFVLMFVIFKLRDKDHISMHAARPSKVESFMKGLAHQVVKRPLLMLMIGVLLSVAGFTMDHSLKIETNLENLMPQDAPELKELHAMRNIVGATNELTFMVQADDVTQVDVIHWIDHFQTTQLTNHSELEDATSIVNAVKQGNNGEVPSEQVKIDIALNRIPAELKENILSEDKKIASLSFSVGDLGMKEQKSLLDHILKHTEAPTGISIVPAGSQMINIESVGSMTENRHFSTLVGVIAIIAGLLAVYRSIKMALYPVVPILLVIGWSSGIMYLLQVEINPLTAVLGSLVLGIGSEFTILVMERYQEERELGLKQHAALIKALSKTGRAITASGLTVVAGFSTLIFSDFVMLRSFGITTVLDTLLCLISALIILPAIIVVTERKTNAKQ